MNSDDNVQQLTSMIEELMNRVSLLEDKTKSKKSPKKKELPLDHPDKVIHKAKSLFYHNVKKDPNFMTNIVNHFNQDPMKKSLVMNWTYIKTHTNRLFEGLNPSVQNHWKSEALASIMGVTAASASVSQTSGISGVSGSTSQGGEAISGMSAFK
jgi:hypothetical protein